MNNSAKLIIFGTGEIGSMAHYYFKHDSNYEVVAFTADDEYVNTANFEGLPLVPFSEVSKYYPPADYFMHVGLSYRKLNQTRMQKYNLAKSLGYQLASYICTKSVTWPDLSVGDNCFILENQTIQPTVKIGSNVMLWSGNHIGHRTTICDHVYLASHVCISGYCEIGERSFIGVNASIRDFTKIGSDCFITMGSVVTSDLQAGSVILSGKNEVLKAEDRRAQMIKKKYFNLESLEALIK